MFFCESSSERLILNWLILNCSFFLEDFLYINSVKGDGVGGGGGEKKNLLRHMYTWDFNN